MLQERTVLILMCVLCLTFYISIYYKYSSQISECNILDVTKRILNRNYLTFEEYEHYREIYEDAHLINTNAPLNFAMEERLTQIKTISQLYNFYRENAEPKRKSDSKNLYVTPRDEMICDALHNVNVSYYKRGDSNFRKLKMDHIFPKEPFLNNQKYDTCALVSNAGSMIGSKQGRFIDSHDLVVRFNHAKTEGYEIDVGYKTDLRIVNSLFFRNEGSHPFSKSREKFDSNETIYITFEVSDKNQEFMNWSTTFNSYLQGYKKQRNTYKYQKFYMLDYNSLWSMQDWLNSQTKYPIKDFIPSSGFIGFHTILKYCDVIRLFEFIPSKRQTDVCHYFEKEVKENCSFKGYHSFAAEKLSYYIMGNYDRREIFNYGYVTIDTRHCSRGRKNV